LTEELPNSNVTKTAEGIACNVLLLAAAMNPKTLRVVIAIVLVAGLGTASVYFLQGSSIEYTNLQRAGQLGKTVQVVGTWDKPKGMNYDVESNIFSFTMKDEQGKSMFVELTGAKPNNFEIATSIVVKGRVEGNTLKASHVLTKCPSKYEGNASDLKRTT
jgi:cytochrome c-type biogenesis protein CcmE